MFRTMSVRTCFITSTGTFSQLQIPGLSNFNTGTTLINGDALALVNPVVIVNTIVARSGSNIAGFGP